jgi:hypothetical protein
VVVTYVLHLYFRAVGWGKERGLLPPFGWSQKIRELELPSGCIMQIGVWIFLPIVAGEIGH